MVSKNKVKHAYTQKNAYTQNVLFRGLKKIFQLQA